MKLAKKCSMLLLVGGLCFANQLAYAGDFKLGYVDVGKIFTTSKLALAMQEALKVKFAPQQKQLKAMNAELLSEQKQMEAYMKKAPTLDKLNPTDRANVEKLEATYQKQQMAFQQAYAKFQRSLQRTQDYASAAVLNRTNVILKSISDREGYDLVLTSNQLVYAKPKYDLTDQVIAQLNTETNTDILKQVDALDKEATANPYSTDGRATAAGLR